MFCFSRMGLLVIFISLFFASSLASASEVDALYAFKQAVSDPDGVLSSWDASSVSPCTWFYVRCSERGGVEGSVISISLGRTNLGGQLVPDLAKLPKLRYLALFSNHFIGSIPAEFGSMKQLSALLLFDNALTGSIPPSLANLDNLILLRLQNNKLTGRIPNNLTTMPKLGAFNVSNNNLSGPVPQGGCFSHFTSESFKGNPGLCGPVLKKPC